MQIPSELRAALLHEASFFSQAALAVAAARISAAYREGKNPGAMTREEALAYALVRMPATYAATVSVLSRLPAGGSLLDLGAGPGTVGWAASGRFAEITLMERDSNLMSLGKKLACFQANWLGADLLKLPDLAPHDVVTMAYSLGEVGGMKILDAAWNAARDAMVVIEAGSPRGFATVRAARTRLIELGASIAAPCPHNGPCPVPENDWCHFAARVERSALHRKLKGGDLSYEDEKFSYVVATKGPVEPAVARIIRRPVIEPGLIRLTLCTRTGLTERQVRKRDAEIWRWARKAEWGGTGE